MYDPTLSCVDGPDAIPSTRWSAAPPSAGDALGEFETLEEDEPCEEETAGKRWGLGERGEPEDNLGNPSSKASLICVSTRDLVPSVGMLGKNIGRLKKSQGAS